MTYEKLLYSAGKSILLWWSNGKGIQTRRFHFALQKKLTQCCNAVIPPNQLFSHGLRLGKVRSRRSWLACIFSYFPQTFICAIALPCPDSHLIMALSQQNHFLSRVLQILMVYWIWVSGLLAINFWVMWGSQHLWSLMTCGSSWLDCAVQWALD